MRNTGLFLATAIAGTMALSAPAQAGPLGGGLGGGLGGVLGGGFGGGLGGLSGGLGGSINGDVHLEPGQTIDPVTGRVVDAPAKARKTTADAQRMAHTATAGVQANVQAAPVAASAAVSNGVRSVAALPPRVVVAAAPGVGYIGDAAVVRRRQSAALYAGGVTVLSAPDAYVYMDRQAEVLRHKLAGTGVVVDRQGDDIVLELPSDVTFAFDKSDIRERFFPVLSAVAQTLNQYPATYVDVIGHTDAIGSVPYNQALSERRALSVTDFIQRREAIPARLYAIGRGKSEPIATNATVQGRAENRRVEILLHPYTAG